MKIRSLFIILLALFFISCGSEEKEAIEKTAPPKIKKTSKEQPQEAEDKVEEIKVNTNPLSEYITDEVYEEGLKKFYGEDDGMFLEESDKFVGSYEDLSNSIRNKFKITMLATQGGKTSAVLYYPSETGMKRMIVTMATILEVDEQIYYIKTFKDRVEIKQGKKGQAVPLYLRER